MLSRTLQRVGVAAVSQAQTSVAAGVAIPEGLALGRRWFAKAAPGGPPRWLVAMNATGGAPKAEKGPFPLSAAASSFGVAASFPLEPSTVPVNPLPYTFNGSKLIAQPASADQDKYLITERKEPRFSFVFPEEKPEVLAAALRERIGRTANAETRLSGFVPCVVFSPVNHGRNYPLSVEAVELERLGRQTTAYSSELLLAIRGMAEPLRVMCKNWERDMLTRKTISVQFQEVEGTRPIKMIIPVILQGVEDCVGVKRGAVLLQPTNLLKVTYDPVVARKLGFARPPNKLVIDVIDLVIGTSLHAKNVPLPPFLSLEDKYQRNVLTTFTKHMG